MVFKLLPSNLIAQGHNLTAEIVLSRACSAGGNPLKNLIPVKSSMSRTLAVFSRRYLEDDSYCKK